MEVRNIYLDKICPWNCASCNDAATECTSCLTNPDLNLNSSLPCNCKNGFYEKDLSCNGNMLSILYYIYIYI